MIARALTVLALSISIFGASYTPVAHAQIYAIVTEVGGVLGGVLESAVANTESAAANSSTAVSTDLSATISNVLNGIAWDVAKAAIQAMTNSIVNWINSGFNGSPAFETNLKRSLSSLADLKARQFFDELSTESSIQSPFLEKVAMGVGAAYYVNTNKDRLQTKLRYTLKEFTKDDTEFLQGNFAKGGFDAWFGAWLNPQNNPIGASYIAGGELAARTEAELFQRLEELRWGNSFLSWRGDCLLESDSSDSADLSASGADTCAQYDIVTPGSYTENLLGITSTSPIRQLELADSINEIVDALLVQLVTQALEGDGLRGLSEPGKGGGKSALERATDSSKSGANGAQGIQKRLDDHKADVQLYRDNWAKVKTAALTAQTTLDNRSCKDEELLQARVTDTIAKADASGPIADTALTEIEKVVQLLKSTQGNGGGSLSDVSRAYTGLLSSRYLISDPQLTASKRAAENTGESRPGSLLSQMGRIAKDCDEPPKY